MEEDPGRGWREKIGGLSDRRLGQATRREGEMGEMGEMKSLETKERKEVEEEVVGQEKVWRWIWGSMWRRWGRR